MGAYPGMHFKSRKGISRVAVALIVLVVVAAAGTATYYVMTPTPNNSVTLMLNFTPNSYHAPFYYGLAQGIYKENGINMTIQPGQNDGAPISAVAAGQAQFGITEVSNLVQAVGNSNISNVRVVAIIYPKTIYAVIYNKAAISSVSDLAGKTAGAMPRNSGGIATLLFDVMAQANGINLSSITFDYASSAVHNAELVSGKIDFSLTAMHQLPTLQALAQKNGIQLGAFPYGEYGVNTYGLALITSTQMIQQHSDVVKRFVSATMQSLQGSMNNPSAAVKALTAAQPQLNYTLALEGFQLDLSCCSSSTTSVSNPLQLGWIDPTQMQQTINIVVTGLNITKQITAGNLYTDTYVMQP